jgi:hypothetical protein
LDESSLELWQGRPLDRSARAFLLACGGPLPLLLVECLSDCQEPLLRICKMQDALSLRYEQYLNGQYVYQCGGVSRYWHIGLMPKF